MLFWFVEQVIHEPYFILGVPLEARQELERKQTSERNNGSWARWAASPGSLWISALHLMKVILES